MASPSGLASVFSLKRQPFSLSSTRLFKLPIPAFAFPFFSPDAKILSNSEMWLMGLPLRSRARMSGSQMGSFSSCLRWEKLSLARESVCIVILSVYNKKKV